MEEAIDGIGTVVGGGIVAHEVDRIHADGHSHETHCLNCGTELRGDYCSACGQAGHVHRTAMALLHDIAHGVFHFEGRIWHTLPMLVRRPGELTRRYVHGERVKFVSPMALFLFSVFLMFATTSSITKNWDFFKGDDMAKVRRDLGAETARLRERVTRLEARRKAAALPSSDLDEADEAELATDVREAKAELADTMRAAALLGVPTTAETYSSKPGAEPSRGSSNTGSSWLDEKIRNAQENPKLMLYKVKTAAYKYSWALIPISLPFIWLLFPFRRGVGMYDHAIFATYSLAFMMLLAVVLVLLYYAGVASGWLWTAWSVIPPVHMYRQLKGAYALSRFGAAWRTIALLIMVTITSTLFFLLLLYLGVAD